MPVKHTLELKFQPSHVQEPLTCEMTKRFRDVMFNIESISVGTQSANMRLSLLGRAEDVRKAKAYIRSLNVSLKTISAHVCKAKAPEVPMRQLAPRKDQRMVERKIWLTFLGTQRRQPFMWVISRRFDVTYKITQSTTGKDVAILSLVLWGPQEEVDGVVSYLREQGIHVEFGEMSASAPFGPD